MGGGRPGGRTLLIGVNGTRRELLYQPGLRRPPSTGINRRIFDRVMHDPDGPTPKPPSTWGNATGVALRNVHYRTPA